MCSSHARALKQTGFLETLQYDATTTTAVLSSIAYIMSDFETDYVVNKISISQI